MRSAGRWDDPKVATPADRGTGRCAALVPPGTGHRARRLTYRLGEGDEVVAGGWRGLVLAVVPHEIPAAGRGQAAGVLLAQVVRVGLGERGQRTDDRGGLGVDVRQCRDR